MIWPFTTIKRLKSQNTVMAWFNRASFEAGYRAAKPDTQPKEWLDDWKKSTVRAELKKMGYISEKDGFR